jgi:hypothetical protein
MADSFELGRHEAQIAGLDSRMCRVEFTVNDINTKVDGIALSLAEKRGERKALAYIASAAGGLAALIVTLIVRAVFR